MTEPPAPAQTLMVPEIHGESGASSRRTDHDAPFTTLFREHFSYVWHSLRRLGIRERDLEDVTHDVFVVVHRILDTYDPARPIKPWLFGVAFRVASDHRRLARNVHEHPDDTLDPADTQPAADERLETADRQRLVLAALECVEIDRRAVFVMHEIDEQAVPDIAAALGIPLNTAYSRLRLAREEFAEAARRLARTRLRGAR